MSGIRSYDLSGDQVKSLAAVLKGDGAEKEKWITELDSWLRHHARQMEILRHAEQWFKEYALKSGVHLGHHDWAPKEERLMDWVYYQMEYVSGLVWDHETQKVIINKYASSRPLLDAERTQELLDFVTTNLKE